jgi:hypothetical protein
VLLAASTVLATTTARPSGVRWKVDQVALTVDASIDESAPGGPERVDASGRTWQAVGANTPTISVSRGEVGPVGYVVGGKNQNTVRAVAKGHPLVKGALAVTVLTYDAKSRTILDADVLLNGAYRFVDIDEEAHPKNVYDLQAVLTHELGHFHGLDDDLEHPHAVMFLKTSPGDASKRTLSSEDEIALFSLYAEGDSDEQGQAAPTCASPAAHPSKSGVAIIGALVLAAFGLRRRATVRHGVAVGLGVAVLAGSASASPGAGGTATTSVVAATMARWEGGLIVTELELSPGERVTVPGGRVGDIVQVVSHAPVPKPGDRVRIEVSEQNPLGRYHVVSRIAAKEGADHD